VAGMAGFHWRAAELLASVVLVGSAASCTWGMKSASQSFAAANYNVLTNTNTDELTVFPPDGNTVTMTVPFRLRDVAFGADGRSLYGINVTNQNGVIQDTGGLSKVEFNPIRRVPVPGTAKLGIWSFAFSAGEDKVVISGYHRETGVHCGVTDATGVHCAVGDATQVHCGLFEILLPSGTVRQVLSSACYDHSSWGALSLSPNGDVALATVGDKLELVDLVNATTKPVSGEVQQGVWSPDGKWIAAFPYPKTRIFLIDAGDFSKRTDLGGAPWRRPDWSPDSRYLLLWKYQLFRCGVFLDVDGPATLEMLDIQSGRRSTIPNSQCRVEHGWSGWISGEIVK